MNCRICKCRKNTKTQHFTFAYSYGTDLVEVPLCEACTINLRNELCKLNGRFNISKLKKHKEK